MHIARAAWAGIKRVLGPVALPFAVSRGLLLWFAWWTLRRVPLVNPPWQAFPDNRLLDGWLRWDSGWYWSLAREGYRLSGDGGASNVAFFPLFPAAAALASLPLRPFLAGDQAVAIGGLLVSHAAFLVALVGLRRLAERRIDTMTADRVVWLVCLFPYSMFMSAFYAEALFVALAVWTFAAADDEHWGRAAVFAGLATLTRIPGLVVCGALALELLRRRGWHLRRLDKGALAVALAPLSLGALMIHHAVRFGDPLIMFHIRRAGWRKPPGPMTLYTEAWGLLFDGGEIRCTGLIDCLQNENGAHLIVGCLNMAVVPLAVWLSLRAARRFGAGLGAYAIGTLTATLLNGVEGTGRVVATLFPAFLAAAATAKDRALFRAACVASVPLLLLLTFYFSHWFHVT